MHRRSLDLHCFYQFVVAGELFVYCLWESRLFGVIFACLYFKRTFSNRSLGISIESISAIEINMMLFLEQKCLRRRNFQDKIVLIQNCSVRQCSRTRIFKMKISEMKIFKIKNFEEKMFNMRMFTKNRWHPEEEHLQNIIFDDYYLWNSFQSLSFVHEKSMRSSLFLSPHDWNIHFK